MDGQNHHCLTVIIIEIQFQLILLVSKPPSRAEALSRLCLTPYWSHHLVTCWTRSHTWDLTEALKSKLRAPVVRHTSGLCSGVQRSCWWRGSHWAVHSHQLLDFHLAGCVMSLWYALTPAQIQLRQLLHCVMTVRVIRQILHECKQSHSSRSLSYWSAVARGFQPLLLFPCWLL